MRTDRVPGLGIAQGPRCSRSRAGVPAQGHGPVPRGESTRSRRTTAAGCILLYDEARQSQVRDLLPVRRRLPDRDHRHGRRRHQEPLPRPLGPAGAVRRAARGVGAAALRPAGAGRGFDAVAPHRPRPARRDPGRGGLRPAQRCCASSSGRRTPYGHLPVAALQHIAHQTGAWYSEIYGIATSTRTCASSRRRRTSCAVCRCAQCTLLGGGRVREAFREHLGTDVGGVSPDGAVRLVATDCGGESQRTPPRRWSTASVLPRRDRADAATIAAALRAHVRAGTARPEPADPARRDATGRSILLARVADAEADPTDIDARRGGSAPGRHGSEAVVGPLDPERSSAS